ATLGRGPTSVTGAILNYVDLSAIRMGTQSKAFNLGVPNPLFLVVCYGPINHLLGNFRSHAQTINFRGFI
ncbi:MAG: hypothetical protein O7A62_07095, partial [Alphaproteobacteria bacterium]|nr:hypothetical protein [Alphaproteobacteria bacterium]